MDQEATNQQIAEAQDALRQILRERIENDFTFASERILSLARLNDAIHWWPMNTPGVDVEYWTRSYVEGAPDVHYTEDVTISVDDQQIKAEAISGAFTPDEVLFRFTWDKSGGANITGSVQCLLDCHRSIDEADDTERHIIDKTANAGDLQREADCGLACSGRR